MKLHGLVALVTVPRDWSSVSASGAPPIALRLAKDAATVGVHYGHHQAANEVIQLLHPLAEQHFQSRQNSIPSRACMLCMMLWMQLICK